MMKNTFAILSICLIVLSGCSFQSISSPSTVSSPEDAGLVWQECKPTQSHYSDVYNILQLADKCFGQTESSYKEDSAYTNLRRIGMQDYELTIDQDVYLAKYAGGSTANETFILYKNDQPISTLSGKFTAHSPNIGLINIGGKAAWEFSDGDIATIIYDGQDVQELYSLEKAFRPYSLDNKLIFIGQKDSKYFVMYDGIKLPQEFDNVRIAFCCESALYSAIGIHGKYIFLGTRNDEWYLVQIEASK